MNALLDQLPNAERYLEVGVERGLTIETIKARSRTGVDPAPRFDPSRLPLGLQFFEGTSDRFFDQLEPDAGFDLVFLDGLHVFRQAYRDLLNTLAHLRDGAVLVDDTVPCDEVSAMPDQVASFVRRKEEGLAGLPWHGDVWKVVVCAAWHHPELELRTIMGSGNPQTLMWKKLVRTDKTAAAPDALNRVDELAYGDVFAGGPPDFFRPCTEREALSACVASLGAGTVRPK